MCIVCPTASMSNAAPEVSALDLAHGTRLEGRQITPTFMLAQTFRAINVATTFTNSGDQEMVRDSRKS